MKRALYYFLAVIVALASVSLACGSSNTGQKIGESDQPQQSAPAQAQVQIYKIGDIIQVGNSTIVLNSANLSGGKLTANFTVENKDSSDLTVSSLMSFEAKDSDGVKLQIEIGCGTSSMDGTILPGDKLKGDICWSGATTDSVKIYYKADFISSGATVWQIP